MSLHVARVLMAAAAVVWFVSVSSGVRAEPPLDVPPPAAAPAAQAPKEKLPEAREVIKRHVKAIGGEEALRAKKSIHTKCKLSSPGQNLSGSMEILAAPPNKLLVKSILPFVTTTAGFDGTTGWLMDTRAGARLANAEQLPALRERADFLAVLHDDKHFKTITNEGVVDFDKRKCYKIILVRQDDKQTTEYYDVTTGLLAGRQSTVDGGPTGEADQTAVETDYKKFGDLMFATKVIRTVMGQEVIMTVDSVEFDTLEPSTFDLPAEVKALLEKPAEDKE